MSLRSWLRGSPANGSKESSRAQTPSNASRDTIPLPNGSAAPAISPAVAQEFADLEDALAAADLIMNDDIEGAEARLRLKADSSTFHLLGLGVAIFMRGVLGFEKEIMAEANTKLADCENQAWNDMRKAQREAEKAASGGGGWFSRGSASALKDPMEGRPSKIYPPGSEYALVYAEAQLMNAVILIQQESLTEGAKGLYKLRKAYITLSEIMESEIAYLKTLENGGTSDAADGEIPSTEKPKPTAEGNAGQEITEKQSAKKESEDVSNAPSPASAGEDEDREIAELEKSLAAAGTLNESPMKLTLEHLNSVGVDSDIFNNTPVDIFIHSGINMCFGILSLILGMIPPALTRLLNVIGFKGDRERGVQMLWQSTKFRNINGAMAGLVLFAYYNGMLGFADVLPSEADISELSKPGENVGYPKQRCAVLLADMRKRYADSRLWRLEEARVLATEKQLDEAIKALSNNGGSKMRQVTALNAYELSINAMYMMRWELMRDSFLSCIELNDWSHALYYYFAGCAELELYRDAIHRAAELSGPLDEPRELEQAQADARKHKKAADEFFRKVPSVAGRKRFMTRKMPFEVFICRKVQKWEERAAAMGLDLVDAIGISPAMEMTYLWNGQKRMNNELLEKGCAHASWGRCTAPAEKVEKMREEKDELAIKTVTESSFLRALGRETEAKVEVEKILPMDRLAFKGPTKDDYALPAAHYEMGTIAWIEATKLPSEMASKELDEYRRQKTEEAYSYLQQVAKWETYVLDARFGIRIQTGLNTIEWLKGKKGWV